MTPITAAWSWLTASEANVATAVIVTAFAVAVTCLAYFGWEMRRAESRDAVVRREFPGLYRDTAGHEAWVREGLPDFEGER